MKTANDLRLGSLLVKIGLVADVWVQRALTLSHYTGLPIGKSLILLNCITPDELRAIVEAQSMIKDNLLEMNACRAAMDIVRRSRWSLADALVVLGVDAHYVRGTRLGELLVGSGSIDAVQLDIALGAGDTTGLPLGRVLVLLNQINQAVIESALAIQREIRAGTLDKRQAIALLQIRRTTEYTNNQSTQYVKIGKLFFIASLLSKEEIKAAVREAKESGRMLGQVLIEKNQISEEILIAALRLQDMVWKGWISVNQAAEVLTSISQLKLGVAESFERMGLRFVHVERNLTLCDFLRIAGYLSGETLEDIVAKTLDSPDLVAKISLAAKLEGIDLNNWDAVLKAGFYNNQLLLQILSTTRQQDSRLINSASLLNELVHSGQMKLDQALVHLSMVKLMELQPQVAA